MYPIPKQPQRQNKAAIAFAVLVLVPVMIFAIFHYAVVLHASTPGAAQTTPTTTISFARPDFQAGVAFPQWSTDAYGPTDKNWTASQLSDMRDQTGARWVKITFYLWQDSLTSTSVTTGKWSSSPSDIAAGIRLAHSEGLRIFVVPHMNCNGCAGWGGPIKFSDPADTSAWFASYWTALEPYVAAASQAGADEFSLGNEYEGLESAPAGLWEQLIGEVAGVNSGMLTYNVNHGVLVARSWMKDPRLAHIGISMYEQIAPTPAPLTADQITAYWTNHLLPELNAFSVSLGKPILLSEIGYKNSTDALYQPWASTTTAPADPSLQVAAYTAALSASFADPHIDGMFFWDWSTNKTDQFTRNNLPAAQVLHTYYRSPQA